MIEVEDMNFFPILVRRVKLLTDTECSKIVKSLDRSGLKQHAAIAGEATSTHLTDKFTLDTIDEVVPIKERLIGVIDDYAESFGLSAVELDNSWINVQGKDSELLPHTHPQSAISGALYLKSDEDSSSIMFYNPNPYSELLSVGSWTHYTYKSMWVPPAPGYVLLFPSWLKHGANGKNQSEERIVLSFNCIYQT